MDKEILESLVRDGKTVKEISHLIKKSHSNTRRWLKKFGIRTRRSLEGNKKWTIDQLRESLSSSDTISDALRKLNLKVRPGNYDTIKKKIKELNIDISHMSGKRSGRGGVVKKDLKEVLVENSNFSRHNLKIRIMKEGLIGNECSICRQKPEWLGKKLSLVLDHINGINDDNRIENLRLLCPNCNSQTSTFCRSKTRYEVDRGNCENCGAKLKAGITTKLCKHCNDFKARKSIRPSLSVLQSQISELGYCGTARLYGVSDNAIRKWVRVCEKGN